MNNIVCTTHILYTLLMDQKHDFLLRCPFVVHMHLTLLFVWCPCNVLQQCHFSVCMYNNSSSSSGNNVLLYAVADKPSRASII